MTSKQCYILYGENELLRHEKYLELRRQSGADIASGNLIDLDAAQATPNQVRNICSIMPFPGSQRMVVLRGVIGRFEPVRGIVSAPSSRRRQTGSELEQWKSLSEYLPNMPPSTLLVFLDGEITEPNPLLKVLAPYAFVEKFLVLKGDRLHAWIKDRVKAAGGTISASAMALLDQLVGNDLWAMSNEITKLVSYCADRTITDGDVRLLVAKCREENVFPLVDAILDGRVMQAQRALSHIMAEGAATGAIISMINRQLRLTTRAKAIGTDASREELRAHLGIKDFALDKTMKQARAYTWARLKDVYGRLVETDLNIKTGKCDGDLALALLVADLRTDKSIDKASRVS